jgi:hypothetical protein
MIREGSQAANFGLRPSVITSSNAYGLRDRPGWGMCRVGMLKIVSIVACTESR